MQSWRTHFNLQSSSQAEGYRLSFKVYSENKPFKYGIKCYKENKLRKGDALAEDNGKTIMTICWMDKKPVLALSTEHDATIA